MLRGTSAWRPSSDDDSAALRRRVARTGSRGSRRRRDRHRCEAGTIAVVEPRRRGALRVEGRRGGRAEHPRRHAERDLSRAQQSRSSPSSRAASRGKDSSSFDGGTARRSSRASATRRSSTRKGKRPRHHRRQSGSRAPSTAPFAISRASRRRAGSSASSLDYERTIQDVVRVLVPVFADVCSVFVVEPPDVRSRRRRRPRPQDAEQLMHVLRDAPVPAAVTIHLRRRHANAARAPHRRSRRASRGGEVATSDPYVATVQRLASHRGDRRARGGARQGHRRADARAPAPLRAPVRRRGRALRRRARTSRRARDRQRPALPQRPRRRASRSSSANATLVEERRRLRDALPHRHVALEGARRADAASSSSPTRPPRSPARASVRSTFDVLQRASRSDALISRSAPSRSTPTRTSSPRPSGAAA